MCEPVSITMGVIGIAGAVSAGMAAQEQAEGQASYQRQLGIHNTERFLQLADYRVRLSEWQSEQYQRTVASAQQSAQGQYGAVLEQVDQVEAATMESMAKAASAAQKGSSFVRASAAESGTQGNSIRLAQQQYALAEAQFTSTSFRNLKGRLRQSERALQGIQAQTMGIINQAMPAPMAPLDPMAPVQQVSMPSMLPYIIQGGSSVIGAAAYQQGIDARYMDSTDYTNRWGG